MTNLVTPPELGIIAFIGSRRVGFIWMRLTPSRLREMEIGLRIFDGNDHSGDPKVVVVDLGNKKKSYKLPSFDAWLDQALRDSGLK